MSASPARLTKRAIDQLPARAKDYFVWDATVPRFGVRVWPTGRKVFLVQYRQGGRSERITLGPYGALTVDQARAKARELLGEAAAGKDPAARFRFDRQSPTVATVCERFMDVHVATRCKPSTKSEYRRAVDLFIKPAFGRRKISDITRADVADLHHKHRDIPYQANRTLGVLSKMFNLSEVWGLRPDGSNPCRHVPKYKEQKRERYLSQEELTCLFETLDRLEREGKESPAATNAFRLLILTGCRLSEIQTLRWEYVQPPYIVLPDSKTGPRKIPLSPPVQEVLKSIERDTGTPWVIAGNVPDQHLTDLQKPWRRIRKAAGLDDVRIHDLRHTYASNAIGQGLSLEIVGKLLGHTQYQTTMRYAHLADDPLKKAADDVSEALAAQMVPAPRAESAQVIAFPIANNLKHAND